MPVSETCASRLAVTVKAGASNVAGLHLKFAREGSLSLRSLGSVLVFSVPAASALSCRRTL
jgi:hypothetical protein